MKKVVVHQGWMLICILVMTVMLLTTTFGFSVSFTAIKGEDPETMGLSQFCREAEDWDTAHDAHRMIEFNGEKCAIMGIAALSEYNPISYTVDIVERFIYNIRFDWSALIISPVKNLFFYFICFVLMGAAFGPHIGNTWTAIKHLYNKIKGLDGENYRVYGFGALCTPLWVWASIQYFRYITSKRIWDVFAYENTITTKYESGMNPFYLFIGVMAVYWIGYFVINIVWDRLIAKEN